jgi:ABC-type multidrug transport system ATPase subunit
MTSPTVSLRSVAVRKPGTLILRSIDLELAPGSATALFGANGSGKTTLLRVVATLLRPSTGAGEVLGAPLGTAAVETVRERIGLVGHEATLYPNLTLGENLELAASIVLGRPARTEAHQALEQVGLAAAADRRAARSSNGMKRRVEFARLLILAPDLLLLDEAHVGLDPDASKLVEYLITDVTSRGGSALVVAHEEERVRPIVDRALTLVDGILTGAAS